MSARLKPLTPELSAVHRFGALLRRLRIDAGFSQPELSLKLYTSKSTLSRAETGVRLLARDLAEACDELLGASGALLAAWLNADSAPPIDSPGERPQPRNAAWHFMPSLCRLALQASSARSGSSDPSFLVPPKAWRAEASTVKARTARSRRDRDLPISPGKVEPGRYPLPPFGDALPDPPPAGASPRGVARSRPGARGTSPRGSAGGGFPKSSYPLGRVAVALARVAAGRV
jgi:transcriptional regulator with XRE-family HTH domain